MDVGGRKRQGSVWGSPHYMIRVARRRHTGVRDKTRGKKPSDAPSCKLHRGVNAARRVVSAVRCQGGQKDPWRAGGDEGGDLVVASAAAESAMFTHVRSHTGRFCVFEMQHRFSVLA
jgi:hypothetical protein